MEEQDSQVRAMRARVEEVVHENERLAGDLSHHMMLLDNRADANVSSLPDEYQCVVYKQLETSAQIIETGIHACLQHVQWKA
eukprot:7700297-Pyramimonas_sp.AAC.1